MVKKNALGGSYSAPETTVVEIATQAVLCGSIYDMEVDPEETDFDKIFD